MGFNEIGRRLNESARPDDRHYAQWIEMYSSDEFSALVDWLRALTDRIGTDLTGAARERVRDVFLTSSRYELAFWSMAWTLETWPKTDPPTTAAD